MTTPPIEKQLTESEKCPHCGASMKARWKHITPGFTETLETFARAAIKLGRDELHLLKDLDLPPIAYANFSALKHWGFVEMTNQSGYWRILDKGLDFLAGRRDAEAEVKVFRNRVIERSKRLVNISQIRKDHTQEFWQQEFPYTIQLSRFVPVEAAQELLF